jgi:hypothetical protein
MSIEDNVSKFLEHHGVKGQRWGVINKDDLKGRASGGSGIMKSKSKNVSDDDSYSDQLQRKYGKDSMKDNQEVPVEKQDGFHRLSPGQKKAAIALGGIALLGGGYYLASKYGDSYNKKLNARYFEAQLKDLEIITKQPMSNFSPGLAAHWEKGVHLNSGSIMQRLSTVRETDIRPQGFFAAFDHEDVQRYKAELPNWWKKWGYKETEGYLVQLKAKNAVKAPSGKETFEIFKKIIDDDDVLISHLGGNALNLDSKQRVMAVEAIAKRQFPSFAVNWANGYDHDPHVQKFFGMIKDRGYNSLIDFNDSGNLAKTPMRMLDGSNFEIVGHEHINEAAIRLAQKTIKPLIMHMNLFISNFLSHAVKGEPMLTVDDILEHHGVKGQQWGVRRARRTERLARAGAKDSSAITRVRALGRLGPVDLVRGRGIRGGAQRKTTREASRAQRIKTGNATVKDQIIRLGSTRMQDVIPVKTKNVGKKTFMDNDKLIVGAAGALVVARLLLKNGQQSY